MNLAIWQSHHVLRSIYHVSLPLSTIFQCQYLVLEIVMLHLNFLLCLLNIGGGYRVSDEKTNSNLAISYGCTNF
jgi:hypothetical protein